MKQGRHDRILELIRNREVSTQEELLNLLKESGYSVTQATVSRDIKQLRLIKTLSANGKYVYTAAEKEDSGDLARKFGTLLAESVIRTDYVGNQIVVKCYSGMANAVCASLDSMRFDGVVGTLAGDDTMLIIMRSEEQTKALYGLLASKIQSG